MSEATSMPNVPAELRELSILEALSATTQRLTRNQLSIRTDLTHYMVGTVLKGLLARDLIIEWDVPHSKRIVYELSEKGIDLMQDPHVCTECGHVCSTAEGLERHFAREHPDVKNEDLVDAPVAVGTGEVCTIVGEEYLDDVQEEEVESQPHSEESRAIVRYCLWPKRPDEDACQWDTLVHSECCTEFRRFWGTMELRIRPEDSGFQIYDKYGQDKAVHYCPSCGTQIEYQAVLYELREKTLEVLV